MKTQIAVIGSDGKIPQKIEKIAESIGREIAKSGFILICGGKGGVMEAACKGVKSEGGTTVGILPSLSKDEANRYVDIIIPTGMGYARNSLVVSTADVVIAIHGGVGTLSEMAMAMNYGKPVVVVRGSGGIADTIQTEFDHHGKKIKVHEATSADAVRIALELS